jgi:hypothetical protein
MIFHRHPAVFDCLNAFNIQHTLKCYEISCRKQDTNHIRCVLLLGLAQTTRASERYCFIANWSARSPARKRLISAL